ncbi:uncharacterized protein LOC107756473 isoform X3 [Sinocyclocheilus rhinocerous]|uniref:uncharacterized protein LOC107756473 isoform X3 n=1 Tax=Sinocyclocheilus rhinocerous TaxID=307959 RepID=UPI0007B90CCC|nr:PREDICTED: uncharacterized protein LOC107756473 isoform X3 [Sinocyclocheilus rhinocerous]
MLTFETLLVKELQKQQSRAEFCDIVLQTRGVSVPVHSCVLSAFSPWLCGALSAMPSLRNGQRRLIEVQAVEACTLLSLVSLLYSGQLNEDKEEVLSAACKLGIDIPQQVSKRPATERNTQTECMKEMVERECQTEAVPSECQNPKETIESVHLIGTSSWRTDQGLCTYTDGSDITLATLQNIQGNPENMPSFQVMDVVPENAMYPTASGPASLPQDTAPPQRRRRGRPRKRPLPKPDVSQNFSGISPPDQKTLNPPALSMLHTAALPAANQTSLTQPMDWLIDDVIAQLPFMPSNQNGITVDSNMDHTRTQSSVKLTDLGIVQPQSEGELTDILDSFLRTFEQHVGVCDSDVQDGMVHNITDGTRTCGQSYTVHTNAHATSVNTTTQGSKASLSKNRPRVSSARRPQKPSRFWQVSGVKMEKSTGQQSEQKPKSGRMTRSQSRKRKLDVIEELPRRDELPTKRKRKRKKEQTEKTKVDASLLKEKKRKKKTGRLHSEEKCTGSTADSSCSVASALSKVINTASGQNVKCVTQTTKALDRSKSSELHAHKVSSLVKEKQVGHAKRDTSETLLEGSTLKAQCSTGSSQPKLSATKNKSTGSRPALSAFELMKKILENHQKREEEHKGKDNRMWTVKKQKGKERLTNAHVRGAEVKITENKEKNARIRVEGHNKSRINQKDKERSGRIKEAGNQKNVFLQQNLPSANGCSMSKGERLMEDGYSKPRSETADSLNDSPLQRCSTEGIVLTNTADKSFVSHAQEPTTPLEKLGNPQGSIAISEEDEDVDVVEVSSSLSESFSVPPITADIVLSTEDSDEDDEIDVINLGSN